MTRETDFADFAKALGVLAEALNAPLSHGRIEAYFAGLRDVPWPKLRAALLEALSTWTRADLPTPGQLRELALGRVEDRADLAWGELLRAVQRVGAYRTPMLDAATAAAITDVWGSWRVLCETIPSEGPELVGWIKQFKAAYGARTRRDAADERLSALPPAFADAVRQIAAGKGMPS